MNFQSSAGRSQAGDRIWCNRPEHFSWTAELMRVSVEFGFRVELGPTTLLVRIGCENRANALRGAGLVKISTQRTRRAQRERHWLCLLEQILLDNKYTLI